MNILRLWVLKLTLVSDSRHPVSHTDRKCIIIIIENNFLLCYRHDEQKINK